MPVPSLSSDSSYPRGRIGTPLSLGRVAGGNDTLKPYYEHTFESVESDSSSLTPVKRTLLMMKKAGTMGQVQRHSVHHQPQLNSYTARRQQHNLQHSDINAATLPNHYIQEGSKMLSTSQSCQQHPMAMAALPTSQSSLSGSSTLMQLSQQPPPPPHLYHDYPHIIIGGTPFYLIPSDPNSNCSADCETDSYAYPQQVMPIYEEIDPYAVNSFGGGVMGHPAGPPSDQGEVGSLRRPHSPSGNQLLPQSHPLVEQQLTSQLSSQLSSHQGQGCQAHPRTPRVVINPLTRDASRASGRTVCSSTLKKSPGVASASTGSSSNNSSMYYYSDTLHKRPANQRNSGVEDGSGRVSKRLSYDSSDSGLGTKPALLPSSSPSSSMNSSGSENKTHLEMVAASPAASPSAVDAKLVSDLEAEKTRNVTSLV